MHENLGLADSSKPTNHYSVNELCVYPEYSAGQAAGKSFFSLLAGSHEGL